MVLPEMSFHMNNRNSALRTLLLHSIATTVRAAGPLLLDSIATTVRADGPLVIEVVAQLLRLIRLDRAGVCLWFGHANRRQSIQNGPALDFEFPRQIVDSNFAHPPSFPALSFTHTPSGLRQIQLVILLTPDFVSLLLQGESHLMLFLFESLFCLAPNLNISWTIQFIVCTASGNARLIMSLHPAEDTAGPRIGEQSFDVFVSKRARMPCND
jgi:hypothetical protein